MAVTGKLEGCTSDEVPRCPQVRVLYTLTAWARQPPPWAGARVGRAGKEKRREEAALGERVLDGQAILAIANHNDRIIMFLVRNMNLSIDKAGEDQKGEEGKASGEPP